MRRLLFSLAVAVVAGLVPANGTERRDSTNAEAEQHHCYLSSAADAQSSFIHIYGGHDSLTGWGTFEFAPITWPFTTGGCRWARVEVYLAGIAEEEKSCEHSVDYAGSCAAEAGDVGPEVRGASAAQVANSSTPKYYGVRSVYVNRFIIDVGLGWWPHSTKHASTNLGSSPQEECEAQNNLWNQETQTCEFNPDGGNGSPIIIPVGKKVSYKLTSVSKGVRFDLDNDGLRERVSWTQKDAEFAFLAIDRNADGKITNGSELFGDRTLTRPLNGFIALQTLMPQDPNGDDAAIEEGDPLFDLLLLWTDRNQNGLSEPDELQPAKNVVTRIGVGYNREPGNVDKHGNEFLYRGWAERRTAPGKNAAKSGKEHRERLIPIYDVFLRMVNVADQN